MNMTNKCKEKECKWILSQVASIRQLHVYTGFNEQIHKDKDEAMHIDFIHRICKTNNENGTFQIC